MMRMNYLMKSQNPKMKKLLLLLFISLFCIGLSAQLPKQSSPPKMVNDYSNALSKAENNALEKKLFGYADTSSTEITIVILDNISGQDPNLFAAQIGQKWGVGKKGKDNGLVILVALKERKMAIQNGYGLEEYLTDYNTKAIIDQYITPAFKSGNYYAGLDAGTTQIINLLNGKFEGGVKKLTKKKKKLPWSGVIILLIILYALFRNRGNGGGSGRYHGGYMIGGMGGSAFGRSGSGFGGGSGGFGGFGGGSFGGGGASGSW